MRSLSLVVFALSAASCSGPGPVCGNGLVEAFEQCDDGTANADDAACTIGCTRAFCGDGLVGPGEACDDANDIDDDSCRSDCHVCGDGIVGGADRCDDGNDVLGDGCEACLRDGDPRRWFDAPGAYTIHASDRVHVVRAPSGRVWGSTHTLDGSVVATLEVPTAELELAAGGSPSAVAGEDVFAARDHDPDPTYAEGAATHVVRFDASGAIVWSARLIRPDANDSDFAVAVAASASGVVVAGWFHEWYAISRNSDHALVGALDPRGAERYRWTFRVRNERTVAMAVNVGATGEVATGGLYHELVEELDLGWAAVITSDGATRWSRTFGSVVHAVAFRGAEVLVVGGTTLDRLDAATGAPLGSIALDIPADVEPRARFDDGFLICIGAGEGGSWISVHDADGSLLWSAERDTPQLRSGFLANLTDAALGDDGLLYVASPGTVYVYDPHL